MANRRIKDLTEKTSLASGDYFPIDNNNGTKKVNASKIMTPLTNVQGEVSNNSDVYSTSKAYKVGDYVIYNNVLYKCTSACSAGSWATNSSHFTSTTLATAVTALNSALNDQLYPDYGNNIRTNVSSVDMTANTSSFLIAKISNNGNTLYDGGILVDNHQIGHVSNGETVTICIPIKKGSSVKTRNLSNVSYNVWMWGA